MEHIAPISIHAVCPGILWNLSASRKETPGQSAINHKWICLPSTFTINNSHSEKIDFSSKRLNAIKCPKKYWMEMPSKILATLYQIKVLNFIIWIA